MPADGINGWWTVTVIDTDNFTFISTITAGSTEPTGGGTLVQGCKVTGTFEATDGVIDNGSTLYLVDNSNVQTAIKYTPISYSDNYFAYSPYQDWIVSWLTAAGSLGTVMKGDPVNYDLSAGIATLVPEEPFPVTYITTSAPNGTTLNSSTGQLTGNPTTAGVNNFTVQATNGYKTDGRAYSILVEGNVRVELNSVRMKGGFKFTGQIQFE